MRALDLFCGAGGVSEGLHRAGFDVVGVDIKPQPNYPFEFYQRDALDVIAPGAGIKYDLIDSLKYEPRDFDLIWASCPCQAHSDLQKQNKREYPDLIAPTRALLEFTGVPWIIENVEGAPLHDPITLCGTMFEGLRVIRHRLFESSLPLTAPPCRPHPLVFTYDKRKAHYGKLDQNTSFVQVTGGGNCTVANARDAMGIDWMTKDELNEAIPPAYAEFLGRQVIAQIERVAA